MISKGKKVSVVLEESRGGRETRAVAIAVVTNVVQASSGAVTYGVRLGSGETISVSASKIGLIERENSISSVNHVESSLGSDSQSSIVSVDDEIQAQRKETQRELEMPVSLSASEDNHGSLANSRASPTARLSNAKIPSSVESRQSKRRRSQREERDDESVFENSPERKQLPAPHKATKNDACPKQGPTTNTKSQSNNFLIEKPQALVMQTMPKSNPIKQEINAYPFQLTEGSTTRAVAEYLFKENRPAGVSTIAQSLKATFTRSQIEKALASLALKKIVVSFDDSRIFWIDQDLMRDHLAMVTASENGAGQEDFAAIESVIERLDKGREGLNQNIKSLLLVPSDDAIDEQLQQDREAVSALDLRMEGVRAAEREAAKLGLNAADLSQQSIAENKLKCDFYRRCWQQRRTLVMELVLKVCDAKGYKGAAKRALIEEMGLDEDPK